MKNVNKIKFMLLFVLAATLYTATPVLAAESEDDGSKTGRLPGVATEAHVWGDRITVVSPTCTTEGKSAIPCTHCSEVKEEEVIPAAGHNYVVYDYSEPTCKKDGFIEYECTVCGDRVAEHLTVDHDYSEATCTEAASCKTCGKTKGEELGHDMHVVIDIKATCIEEGHFKSECSRCDHVEENTTGLTDHNWTTSFNMPRPTCTEDAVQVQVCAHCGLTQDVVIAEALGHAWNYADECLESDVCERCGLEGTTLGHLHIVDDASVEATCTETGLTSGSHCEACDTILVAQEVTEALGHAWNYADECLETDICTRCNLEGNTLNHLDIIHAPAVAPSCEVTGLTEGYYCGICHEILVAQETVDALEHSWVEIERIEPQVGVEGKIVEECQNCGKIRETIIPALPELEEDPEEEEETEDDPATEEETTEEETDEPDNSEDVLGEYIPEPENPDEPDNSEGVLGDYIPKTGDDSNVLFYISLMLVGIATIILGASRKKEEN